MSRSLVLTVIGADKPGLVETLSQAIARHDGNWLESRMARLAGRFAGILRVDVPAANAQALTNSLMSLENHGLRVVVESSGEVEPAGEGHRLRIEVVGQDHPGIIRDISHALARRGVNVEELSTECSSAPMSGETLFRAQAELRIPPDLSEETLAEELEKIAHDLIVELSLEPLD